MTEHIAPTQALKPCPFCNSPAELEKGRDHHGEWFNLGCSRHWGHQRNPDHKNTCIAGRIYYTETDVPEAEAIAAWNTRIAAERTASAEPVAYLYGRDDGSCDLILDCNGEYARSLLESGATETPLYAAPPSADVGELVGRKYRMGDRVTKIKGSSWTGLVVGFYSTSLTPIGYAVESENEPGSVQIYPESALAKHGGAA